MTLIARDPARSDEPERERERQKGPWKAGGRSLTDSLHSASLAVAAVVKYWR